MVRVSETDPSVLPWCFEDENFMGVAYGSGCLWIILSLNGRAFTLFIGEVGTNSFDRDGERIT